jgi:hypothetical protein
MHLAVPIEVPVFDTAGEVARVTIPLSGTLDHYDAANKRLTDYKTTSRPFKYKDASGKFVYRELPDTAHVVQANLYRLLLEHHGYPVESIQIWYVQPGATARQVVTVPLWPIEDAYFLAVSLGSPIAQAVITGELPPCTCRWASRQEPDLCKTFTTETWHPANLPPLVPPEVQKD